MSKRENSFPMPPTTVGKAQSRPRAADQIVDELQRLVANGDLKRGGRLPNERDLAAHFNVSSPTVREAVRVLTSMGLLEVRHGSGTYVAESSRGILDNSLAVLVQWEKVGARELLDLLCVLHLHASDLACTAATDEELSRLITVAKGTASHASTIKISDSFYDFLDSFVAAAHQPLLDALCSFLTRVLVDLENSFHPDQSSTYWHAWAADSLPLRLEVAQALSSRDQSRIAKAVKLFHEGIRARLMGLPGLDDARVVPN